MLPSFYRHMHLRMIPKLFTHDLPLSLPRTEGDTTLGTSLCERQALTRRGSWIDMGGGVLTNIYYYILYYSSARLATQLCTERQHGSYLLITSPIRHDLKKKLNGKEGTMIILSSRTMTLAARWSSSLCWLDAAAAGCGGGWWRRRRRRRLDGKYWSRRPTTLRESAFTATATVKFAGGSSQRVTRPIRLVHVSCS